jgi:plastocyanin
LSAVAALVATAGSLGCARHVSRTQRVAMQNFQAVPASVTVAVGDTVEWTNADFVPHTATALDKSWDSRTIESGATWRMVFRTPGQFAYFCAFHPNMRGEVRVR